MRKLLPDFDDLFITASTRIYEAVERIKLLRSRLAPGTGQPGQVLSGFTIACGTGAIEVLEAQREGKRPMPAAEVLRGLSLPARLA